MFSCPNEGIQTAGVKHHDAEENICSCEKENNRRMEEFA
jgi:hypothetical protein